MVFRLIRYQNILILLVTQTLIYFGLMLPAFNRNGIRADMGLAGFFWMFVITALIAISGYIINDLVDFRTDNINKADRQLVGVKIPLRTVRVTYALIALCGFLLSWIYASRHEALSLLFIYPMAVAFLAFYSYKLKSIPLLGNITVALFSAAVAIIVLLFEREGLSQLGKTHPLSLTTLKMIVGAFGLFAFVSSLFREIVKDMEDLEGDRKAGFQTTAVYFGLRTSKKLALGTAMMLLLMLLFWYWLPAYGSLLAVVTALLMYQLSIARVKADYHRLSQRIKVLMALGLLYLFLYVIIL